MCEEIFKIIYIVKKRHCKNSYNTIFLQKQQDKNVFKKESTSTKIIISHRVSTLKYCDNIIVLKDGEIIQSGNHNKLKNEAGYYKEIYSEQMEAKKTK